MPTVILRPIGKGHSFFSLIEDYCPSEKQSTNRAIHRLCSLMRKMSVETVAIESLNETFPELMEECSALRDHYEGDAIEIKTFRISFISEKISDAMAIVAVDDRKFLASVIIINYEVNGDLNSYIFKAIVALPGFERNNIEEPGCVNRELLLNNYVHVYKNFQCEIEISENNVHTFNIVGTYFSQQNNATSVCGHAALCMAINNMTSYTGQLITPEHINKVIGTNHKTKKFGSGVGLRIEDIFSTLDSFGLKHRQVDFEKIAGIEYDAVIHKYLEGGYPALLIFRTIDCLHVVAVLGHTLNTDLWRPEAEYAYINNLFDIDEIAYRPASEWVDSFIIHDDNFGMYQCLQVDSLKRTTDPKSDPTFRVSYVVTITPDDVTTLPFEAEYASIKVTKKLLIEQQKSGVVMNDWLERLLRTDSLSRISVVRTMLVKKTDYCRSLCAADFENNSFTDEEKMELTRDLPDLFWLSEITLPDLYTANKTKLIDCFYPCDLPSLADIDDIYVRWIQIRFPEALKKNTASGESVYEMSVKSHYPVFRLSNIEMRPEW